MENNIMERLLKEFDEQYQYLKEVDNKTMGFDGDVKTFDELINENEDFCKLVDSFCLARKNPITSDREAAAFVIAFATVAVDLRRDEISKQESEN